MPRYDAGEPAGPRPSSRTPGGDNRAVPASTRTIGIGVVFLLVAGTLAVGLAFKFPVRRRRLERRPARSRAVATRTWSA